MSRNNSKRQAEQPDPATEAFNAAKMELWRHPIFGELMHSAHIVRRGDSANNGVPRDGWAIVCSNGTIRVHPTRRADSSHWVYVLGHCLLHLGFGHIKSEMSPAWNAACDAIVARFLSDIALGMPPISMVPGGTLPGSPGRDEWAIERAFSEHIPDWARALSTSPGVADMEWSGERKASWYTPPNWEQLFQKGLAEALERAVQAASGQPDAERKRTAAESARSWFISSYPLLGALASAFKIVEDPILCGKMDIPVAAIDIDARTIYMNPVAGLTEGGCRFVMAHEFLHAALRHDVRQGPRDAYLWNVSCDFLINDWLLEMGIGDPPSIGMLHDPSLRGMSAEAIYDHITANLRRFRRLATMRGCAASDILAPGEADQARGAADLDAWYRSILAQGLQMHEAAGRGYLPLDLVEEIRALSMPVIPWDVRLAQWFTEHFAPMEKRRSYARASRRQSSTPDIARAALVVPEEARRTRVFGVVLDTSGSMSRKLLGKSLGTIASYAIAHEVASVRVVFCDATAYDGGWMSPEEIAGRVQVRGRGGTILQPGVQMLLGAEDFPDEAPILILTDGFCEDDLVVRREHAFVVPDGAKLPFKARGLVFEVR